MEKLIFMDFAPAVFNGIAATIAIFTTFTSLKVPLKVSIPLTLMMVMVVPIRVFIVLKQIKSQKGIRVELLNSKAQMDGTIVELINGIEVIRISDSLNFETNRFVFFKKG